MAMKGERLLTQVDALPRFLEPRHGNLHMSLENLTRRASGMGMVGTWVGGICELALDPSSRTGPRVLVQGRTKDSFTGLA